MNLDLSNFILSDILHFVKPFLLRLKRLLVYFNFNQLFFSKLHFLFPNKCVKSTLYVNSSIFPLCSYNDLIIDVKLLK